MTASSPLILAVGDSLVAGYGLTAEESFPGQLEAALQASRPGAKVMNAGVSGDTTGDVRQRLPRALSQLTARPDLAILQIGPNDVLRAVPPALTRDNLSALLLELKRCGVSTLLTTVEPPTFLRDRTAAYVGLHAELAAQHGVATVPFFPPGVLGRADMVLRDRVHPNARAITAVVDAMLPTILCLLGSDPNAWPAALDDPS